ncbi:MAG: glycosyltransferase [Candidatus Thiodiazotropha sp. (ex Troendleina suluensis)]|nr:glycosyltransferase [Candidatus Thiodiazotropha sp. (ex Troendleina suluensis)]
MNKLLRLFHRLFISKLNDLRYRNLLRLNPPILPNKMILYSWNRSVWPDYQCWIDAHSINTVQEWERARQQCQTFDQSLSISIVTPVFNTGVDILRECILSVRYQTSPYWQLILVDDGSTDEETLSVLNSSLCDDPRIHVMLNEHSSGGISAASNRGIAEASGHYIAFLDHDDRLATDAIQQFYDALQINPAIDILYSDRDMISTDGRRFMHLMKPDWSPETLLSGNYLFHFMCYRKLLINQVGGLRSDYDGSQDYDLILRCSDHHPVVKHVPRVLYHWRQCELSVSLDENAKGYAFDAGIRALEDTLERRDIKASVFENKALWRGNYQLQFDPGVTSSVKEIMIDSLSPVTDYSSNKQPLFFHATDYHAENAQSVDELAAWLSVDGVGIVCGKCISPDKTIIYGGAVMKSNGDVLFPYRGETIKESGYMAITQIVHNISVPDYHCFLVKPSLWDALGGFDTTYQSFSYQVYDLALRAAAKGWRVVYNPRSVFVCDSAPEVLAEQSNDQKRFSEKWREWLDRGDPFHSPNLSQQSSCYEIRCP